jgi:hypothetical protein
MGWDSLTVGREVGKRKPPPDPVEDSRTYSQMAKDACVENIQEALDWWTTSEKDLSASETVYQRSLENVPSCIRRDGKSFLINPKIKNKNVLEKARRADHSQVKDALEELLAFVKDAPEGSDEVKDMVKALYIGYDKRYEAWGVSQYAEKDSEGKVKRKEGSNKPVNCPPRDKWATDKATWWAEGGKDSKGNRLTKNPTEINF